MANTTNFGWETPDDTDYVKDGAAAMRTLGNSIDTSFVDLKGGTSGQILSKASNTDLDYTWIDNQIGDITGVTAGTGLSGGGTSGTVTVSIDTATTVDVSTAQTLTNKTLTSPVLTTPSISNIDAKGDLLVGTADNTISRLAVGTNNQVLTADSSTATGLKWASAAGGGGLTLLSTTSLSTTTTTISSISGSYTNLILVIRGATWPSFNTTYSIRPNGSTTGAFSAGSFNDAGTGGTGVLTNTTINPWNNNMPQNNANNIAVYTFYNYANTSYYKAWHGFGYMDNSSGCAFNHGGGFKSNSAITSFDIVLGQSVNFTGGQALVYGVS